MRRITFSVNKLSAVEIMGNCHMASDSEAVVVSGECAKCFDNNTNIFSFKNEIYTLKPNTSRTNEIFAQNGRR